MGGYFNNRTFKNIMNKTCSQYFKDKKTLCINPMVATYTGGEPDLKYILDNYPVAATCRLAQEQICAKYTVYNNGIKGPMRTGCIQEKRKNEIIEVCACRSVPGPDEETF
ncbi:hypothetical protein Phum_PHUM467630 [Pediculus humanus corporis]|uniref:Uncharacterized protein n=1 Tax=Pediculus humanus subsp. corporis TaxID=121224 RepID=E0VVU2_PEDHC|nr:uncharacterized protein Phum_PHUM467630 [Pediculus humanus corporis]EEB17498.1 hypothetical protein Phum_PHUM467630 [Pediculus humanus corporis]